MKHHSPLFSRSPVHSREGVSALDEVLFSRTPTEIPRASTMSKIEVCIPLYGYSRSIFVLIASVSTSSYSCLNIFVFAKHSSKTVK